MGIELSGSLTDKEKGFIETWENVGQHTNYIVQENRRGDEVYVPVSGPKKFKLSTYERIVTEDKIVDERLNPFKNGSFRPVVVPDDITIDTNPNAMSSDDIKRVFLASDAAWDAYMDVIDSPATLRRMLDLAEESEITLKRVRQIETALDQYSNVNKRVLAQRDQDVIASVESGSKAEPTVTRRRAAAK